MSLFDPIRRCRVIATPEEIVRQKLIQRLIQQLGFPKSYLAVEKELKEIPTLQDKVFSAEKRRADILCFGKDIHPDHALYPLLLIECKAVPLSEKVIEQVLGYNYFVLAFFVAIANGDQEKIFWYDQRKKDFDSVDFLPSYQELIQAVKGR